MDTIWLDHPLNPLDYLPRSSTWIRGVMCEQSESEHVQDIWVCCEEIHKSRVEASSGSNKYEGCDVVIQ